MDREDAKTVQKMINTAYPRYIVPDKTMMVDLWAAAFMKTPADMVIDAVKAFIFSDTKGFPPTIGQIVDSIDRISNRFAGVDDEMNELAAWQLVWKALRNCGYHAEDEYAKMPEAVKRAVGSPGQLRDWALMDSDTVQSVEQSHFIRSYRAAREQLRQERKLPENMRAMIAAKRAENMAIEAAAGNMAAEYRLPDWAMERSNASREDDRKSEPYDVPDWVGERIREIGAAP